MCVYLIIAAELAILYAVFWYIYLREPKPFTITGNPWGHYKHGLEREVTANGINLNLPAEKTSPLKMSTTMRTDDYHHDRRLHLRRRTSCHRLDKPTQKLKYGWVTEEPWPSRELVEHVLDALKSNVIELNVRVL